MQTQRGTSAYFRNIKNSAESIWNGMGVTLSYMFRRPTTVQYPDRTEVPVRDTLPDRYRGFLEVDVDICTACKACERDCPIDCIAIDLSGKGADKRMFQFDIDIAKCMFCGLCTENCPTGAIQHTNEFEAATISMESLTFRFVEDGVSGVIPYKPPKGAQAFDRAPLGEIVRELIKPWDQPSPIFPGDAPEDEGSAAAAGPSPLAARVAAEKPATEGYAEILEEAMAGTDCGACGYPTCREYSDAIAGGSEETLSLCEPGGDDATQEVKQIVAARLSGAAPAGPFEAAPTVPAVREALVTLGAAPIEAPAAEAAPEAPAEAPPSAGPAEVTLEQFATLLEEAMAGTDCGACEYPDCEGYAQALAKGEIPAEDIERCEPGGSDTVDELRDLFAGHVVKS